MTIEEICKEIGIEITMDEKYLLLTQEEEIKIIKDKFNKIYPYIENRRHMMEV